MTQRRIGLIGLVLGILLVIDGIYMVVSRYNGGETQAWNLPDGWIIIISAAVLLVASILALVLPSRSQRITEASSHVNAEAGQEKG
jgi:uncharacterized membrane protein HdeD (DUF308 family)